MTHSRPNAQPAQLNQNNIRTISGWKNNCASHCVADFLGERLFLTKEQGGLSPETVQTLGKMVGDFYETKPLELRDFQLLFSPQYFFAPINWQIILGYVLRDYIEQQRRTHSQYKDIKDASGLMTTQSFAILAEKLKINVDFYLKQEDGNVIPAEQAVSSLKLADASSIAECKELKNITVPDAGLTLHVLGDYKAKHYNRLVPAACAAHFKKLDNAVNFKPNYTFTANNQTIVPRILECRDDPVAFKAVVQSSINAIQTLASKDQAIIPFYKVEFSLKPQAKLNPVSSATHTEKFQAFKDAINVENGKQYSYAKMIADLSKQDTDETKKWEQLKTLAASESKVLVAKENKTIEYDLNHGTKNSPRIFVTKAKQEELDAQLAKKLQQEEIRRVYSK